MPFYLLDFYKFQVLPLNITSSRHNSFVDENNSFFSKFPTNLQFSTGDSAIPRVNRHLKLLSYYGNCLECLTL